MRITFGHIELEFSNETEYNFLLTKLNEDIVPNFGDIVNHSHDGVSTIQVAKSNEEIELEKLYSDKTGKRFKNVDKCNGVSRVEALKRAIAEMGIGLDTLNEKPKIELVG